MFLLGENFKKISLYFIYFLAIIISIIIFLLNFQYSSFTYSSWYPLVFNNSVISSLAKIIIGIILMVIFGIFIRKNSEKNFLTYIILINIGTLIVRFFIINGFDNAPTADSWQVFNGVNVLFFTDDVRLLYIGNYFALYPQQLGIVTILYPLAIFFRENVVAYYYAQMLIMQSIIILLTLSSYKLKGIKTAFITTVFLNLFIPNYFISFLIYGDIYALLFITIAFTLYVFFKDNQTKLKYVFVALGYIFLVFAYYARLSSNVFILAIIFTLFLVTKFNLKSIVKCILLFSIILFSYSFLIESFNVKDVELGKYAFPTNTWLRIGLGYSGFDEITPGYHDMKTDVEFMNVGYDANKMSEINTLRINKQLESFKDLNTGYNFFKQKIIIMWTDPDFEIMTHIIPFYGTKIENPLKSYQEINYGAGKLDLKIKTPFGQFLTDNYYAIRKYEKIFMFSFLIMLVFTLIKSKKNDIYILFGRLLLIGFFLLHLIIEIKSRYLYVCINALIFLVSLYYLEYFNELYTKVRLNLNRFILKRGLENDNK